jgi:hypothetical protein
LGDATQLLWFALIALLGLNGGAWLAALTRPTPSKIDAWVRFVLMMVVSLVLAALIGELRPAKVRAAWEGWVGTGLLLVFALAGFYVVRRALQRSAARR